MSSTGITYEQELFPAPSLPPSAFSPQRLPGASLESLAALQHVLKDNHRRHHIFLNHTRFHNHSTHRALAIYALGGSASLIKGYYEEDGKNQRPAFESPEPITEENFVEHLGDENFYQSYVTFFSKQIDEKGAAGTLEEFVFSEKYNFQNGRDVESQPEMLSRFVDGLLHPMIHAGYGVEFGLKGMLAEGLAMVAVEDVYERGFYPPSFFEPSATVEMNDTTNLLSSLALNAKPAAAAVPETRAVHAFDIVARMLKDDQLKPKGARTLMNQVTDTLAEYGTEIRRYAEQWTVDLRKPGEIERKMEELVWVSSVVYGVGGFDEEKGLRSDFFLMHMVTSSLFLPSLIAYLSPRSQVSLLRSYFTTVLTFWVARGRPALNLKAFMAAAPFEPTIPNAFVPKTPTEVTPNPFLPIVQSALAHPNDHFVKIQRTFAHFNTIYGLRPAGYFKGTELEGAELLDGSLFVRAAVLTANSMGWVREGQEAKMWDFEGFYDQWL
ncbi:hypothetical protein PAXINDRAFT_170906 [Paxillus involutus ATCC 200175]|uniref:Oxidoreductase AflY n=1 Tax=Paxillus involutus ATCC 200175 TaxID=664439 RepID=A0A0C9TBR1_PAXIN|nr:hypothetical protein PAXINDRAFT_170906 [Paxillus involutus ATCC 200175]